MAPYQGPGEQRTAETLKRDLPDSWHVIAGRKLSGPQRDDMDLILVGERAVFVIDEKSWGPAIAMGDQVWWVNGSERRNPADRVNHLARLLAGQLRDKVSGYPRRGRLVQAGVVLSHDRLTVTEDPAYNDGDVVSRLADAARWLVDRDAACGIELQPVRDRVVEFLTGLPDRDPGPPRIGPYEIEQKLPSIGVARCFMGRDGGRVVLLRCYPLNGWGPDVSPQEVMERERLAMDRLEALDRAWAIHPSFIDEVRQWFVVPVVPPSGKTLVASLHKDDPARADGSLPRQVMIDVIRDAFQALHDVHGAGLLHRGLCPRRVFLGRGLRVKFGDFYLARVFGERTIAPMLQADGDAGVPYRAPECREAIANASQVSDVYSLALTLAGWIAGELLVEPRPEEMRSRVRSLPVVGAVLDDCLDDDPGRRPDAASVVQRVDEAIRAEAAAAAQPHDEFRIGGVVAGRYHIEKNLGVGGFAVTWLARDTQTDGQFVIKQFHDAEVPDYARREYKAANEIHHDRCARVYDMNPGPPGYLVLEYVLGENLKVFAAGGKPDAAQCRDLALDILSALDYLHSHDLVHRDVSPTNIIVTWQKRATLIDFGVAGRAEGRSVVGTPAFAAPETRAGQGATPQSDLYGLAVTMISVMLGRLPYFGDPARGDEDRTRLVPPTADERQLWGPLGTAMLDLLFKAANADPTQRPGSARELIDRLTMVDEIAVVAGSEVHNAVVDDLRGLYRASAFGNAGNRGLDGEFARSTYVPTLLDTKLLPAVLGGHLRLVLLTGNPGDGKTSFLVKLKEALVGRGGDVVASDDAGWRVRLDGHTFVAVYDASESHEGRSSDELLCDALDPGPGEDPQRRTVVLAINDGRLLQFFTDYDNVYEEEAAEIRGQLAGEPPADPGIVLVDLKRRTLAPRPDGSLVGEILDAFTGDTRWGDCDGCLSREVCPIVANVHDLGGPARAGVEELVATSHLRRLRRATFRDVRSALAWLITGDRSCVDVHAARAGGMDLRRSDHALVEDLAFDPRSADYLIREWTDLDPARTAAPEVERAARSDREVVANPAAFSDRDRERMQRRLFFGTWRAGSLGREAVRAYRYLDEFVARLYDPGGGRDDETLGRLLLGLSRLLGAAGYAGDSLALADRGAGGTWAVLKEIPASAFILTTVSRHSDFVESRPDALRLSHDGGSALLLTLDTFELVLRVADGELIGDAASEAVRQEIETFAGSLRHSPAQAVSIVNPAGMPRRAKVEGQRIVLEPA